MKIILRGKHAESDARHVVDLLSGIAPNLLSPTARVVETVDLEALMSQSLLDLPEADGAVFHLDTEAFDLLNRQELHEYSEEDIDVILGRQRETMEHLRSKGCLGLEDEDIERMLAAQRPQLRECLRDRHQPWRRRIAAYNSTSMTFHGYPLRVEPSPQS